MFHTKYELIPFDTEYYLFVLASYLHTQHTQVLDENIKKYLVAYLPHTFNLFLNSFITKISIKAWKGIINIH